MEWISVKDGLPEGEDAVLVSNKRRTYELAYLERRGWCEQNSGDDIVGVTHWARISPPTEG
jgi:hypothetical protein